MTRVVAIVGATATGKSAVALAAARATGAEIVGADAFQLYRGFDLGTAKPTADERALVPHHLVDTFAPHEESSAGEFARRALEVLAGIAARGRSAIVVGGSGFYLRALERGLAPLPAIPRTVRAALQLRLEREGSEALHRELEQIDPDAAARIAARDGQRAVRALEVAEATGRTLSDWQRSSASEPPHFTFDARLGLTLPRAVLYDRIARRVERMVEAGWRGEVEALLASGVATSSPAFRAIGYAEWAREIAGELERTELIERIVRATRRYAKRQETWFRREAGIVWLDGREPERAVTALRKALEE